jgi:hypothetical protein
MILHNAPKIRRGYSLALRLGYLLMSANVTWAAEGKGVRWPEADATSKPWAFNWWLGSAVDKENLAEVTVNGKPLGILWKEPFQADVTAAVKAGENTLTIQITNLWPKRLIGDEKLAAKDRLTWNNRITGDRILRGVGKTTDPLRPARAGDFTDGRHDND